MTPAFIVWFSFRSLDTNLLLVCSWEYYKQSTVFSSSCLKVHVVKLERDHRWAMELIKGMKNRALPVHHQLPEMTQTHVNWVGDAIQPSHPVLSPSPPAFNHSQHQGLFKWVSSSVSASASVLPMNIQGWFPLGLTGLISLLSKGLSRVFSNTTIQSMAKPIQYYKVISFQLK